MPITKVKEIVEEKGVSIAKRGKGTPVASARLHLDLENPSISRVMLAKGESEETHTSKEKVEAIKAAVEEGLKLLAQSDLEVVKSTLSKLDGVEVPILFLRDHEYVLDLASQGEEKLFQIDTDIIDEVDSELHRGLPILYEIALFVELCQLSGLEVGESLVKAVDLYENLKESEVYLLRRILSEPKIDNGNVFLRFLEDSANKPKEEKHRLAAWLRSRTFIELPYNAEKVRAAIQEERDLASLRRRIYNTIRETYFEPLDTANAERIADLCHEEGVRLVTGRFSRAFYLEALMLANSRVLETRYIRDEIEKLEALFKEIIFDLKTPTLREKEITLESLNGEIQRIINLKAERRVSEAQCIGAIEKLKKALREFEASTIEMLDEAQAAESPRIAKERRENDGSSPTWERLLHDREEITGKINRLRRAISDLEAAISYAPKIDPAFLVFFQRISGTGSINIGVLNELKDPFFGEDEEVHELIRGGGHNLYVTPNLRAWLRRCDDWIEALPAYSAYRIIPVEGGRYKVEVWVQRAMLEEMYRRHAEDWALNIEDVMNREHVAIARELLIDLMGLNPDVERVMRDLDLSREEAVREVSKRRNLAEETAGLAALVEATYMNLCLEVAKRRQKEMVSRMRALRMVIDENRSRGNLVAEVIDAVTSRGKPITEAIEEAVKRHNLQKRAEALRSLALKRRRDLPSVHVLTTLGPGETEINVRNWLEESMALFNVSRFYNLEDKVQRRVRDYQRRFIAIGKRLIKELDLEGDLFQIMREEGLQFGKEPDEARGILRLIASYPEVASEASKIALLIEHEERTGARARDPENAEEPATVLKYLEDHPELEEEAIEKVIEHNRLEAEVKAYAEKHRTSLDKAKRAVVSSNPIYSAEKESLMRSEARKRVLESLGMMEEVWRYLKTRLDRTLALVTARREVIGENNLSHELNNPRFRYDASGPFKAFNLLYTPSRVDLGPEEVRSVRNVPKWVGGCDREAMNAGKSLYSLYNQAGVTAVEAPDLAEFLKVGENAFSRGGVFYISLVAGTNIDALGMGDFEFFRDQWNMRGDRIVLPTGETYGGFCVPKEFSLLNAIITAAVSEKTSDEIMDGFGVPRELRPKVIEDLRRLLRMQLDCEDQVEWEEKARAFLSERLGEYFSILGYQAYISRLPQLAETLKKIGVITVRDEEQRRIKYRLTVWVNKKMLGLEEINRIGPFRKVYLIRQLLNEARRKNPEVAPDHKVIGVMSVSYKEGGRKDGKEIPISDVRFSAGCRKLEIYAGTADEHLLKDIDPEGREILREMFKDFKPPADIRIVGSCTSENVLNYVPRSDLNEVKEWVHRRLLEAGLNDLLITSNAIVYGGDLERWVGIKELPEEERRALIKEIGGKIHLLVLDRRGVYTRYEEAIQGVDFIDLGIPDPELLDLVDNLPKMLYLMRKGRPNSALVFADGTSGARRRTFSFRYANSKRKVKELFALDDRAVYGALGLGQETIEKWRQEMMRERMNAEALYKALVEGRYEEAERIYERIREQIILDGRDEEAIEEEIAARRLNVPRKVQKSYSYVSKALSNVRIGLPLHKLDFGTWLILGGMYLLNGKASLEEIVSTRMRFERAVAGAPKTEESDITGFTENDVDSILELFVKPKYVPPPLAEYREVRTGITGSLKAVEETVSILEKREARRRQAMRAEALRSRMRGFLSVDREVEEAVKKRDFEGVYRNAKAILGDGKEPVRQEEFGKFLGWARGMFTLLIDALSPEPSTRRRVESYVRRLFSGGEISLEAYRSLAAETAKMAELAEGDKSMLEEVAKALELLDISLLLERTMDVEDPHSMTIELARFFDATLNSHIFDYIPYHYHRQRGVGFEVYSRREKIELAMKRHRWLYTRCRHLMVTKTELKDLSPEYCDAWLGDVDRNITGLGINLADEAERFWFSYARLRDAVVLLHEGYPLPEVFKNLDPSALKCDERTNVVIVYPHGNTTVPVALEQNPKLTKERGINLLLTAFPKIERDESYGCEVLHVLDGFTFLSKEDYLAALLASGLKPEEAEKKASAVGSKGVLALFSFSRPIVAHGIFFHFTHPLRPEIEFVRAPIIQPLIWEAATYLKCKLPEMLKGSGIRTADQFNWYMDQTARMSEAEAKSKIRKRLIDFSKSYDTVIIKPEKESGGRNAKVIQIRRDGKVLEENLTEAVGLVYEISKSDNVVVQEFLKSYVRRLYTPEFLENLVERFARLGVPVQLYRDPQTPLFSYFRQILVLGEKGYEISHNITVIGTSGVANVGQGGLLYEYTDDIINPKYREDLRREITKASFRSMEAQRRYLRTHWKEILEDYLEIHPEFAERLNFRVIKDLTGFDNRDVPYEMGDYMPVFLVDENDNLVRIYDEDSERLIPLYDENGKPTPVQIYDKDGKPIPRVDENGNPIPIRLFDEKGRRIPLFDAKGRPISSLIMYKIEANPGAGLWRPHNDQLPPHRKGEGVYIIFSRLGERASIYRRKLEDMKVKVVEPQRREPAEYIEKEKGEK